LVLLEARVTVRFLFGPSQGVQQLGTAKVKPAVVHCESVTLNVTVSVAVAVSVSIFVKFLTNCSCWRAMNLGLFSWLDRPQE